MAKIKEILGQRYVLNEDDPYSRQIIMGRNSNNQKAYRYANATTDNLGLAEVQLNSLKPNTKYTIYLSYMTPRPLQPILYA